MTDLVSLLFIVMIPIDCKITNFSLHLLYDSFLVDYAEEMKITTILVYSLAIIVCVNKFQTPEIQAVLSSFFCDSNDIARGSNSRGIIGEISSMIGAGLKPTITTN